MTRRNPPAKWTLPDVVDPPDRICFKIDVPNNIYHLAAFRGAIWNLCSAINWQDDPDHTAKQVASVWRDVYDAVRRCNDSDNNDQGISLEDLMSQQIRISPDDSCIIQMWCIDHWEDWYNPFSCGLPAGQPSGGSPQPQAGGCQSYSAQFDAKSTWLLPTVVSAGDTIEISAVSGAGNDGAFLATWRCPTGQTFFAGACVGVGGVQGGDPAAAVDHMRLVVNIDGTWYDAYNTSITVPGGVSDAQVVFQINDDDLTDNSGSYAFNVNVCNNQAPRWTHTFNLALSPCGFTPLNADPTYGVWIAGIGWRVTGSGAPTQLSIYPPSAAPVDSIAFTLNVTGAVSGTNHSDIYTGSNFSGAAILTQPLTSGIQIVSAAIALASDYYDPSAFDGTYTGDLIISSMTLSGEGTDPY